MAYATFYLFRGCRFGLPASKEVSDHEILAGFKSCWDGEDTHLVGTCCWPFPWVEAFQFLMRCFFVAKSGFAKECVGRKRP